MNCKNCANNFDENFCPKCGQSNKVEKITWPVFLTELSDNIFQINKGLFYTIKELFIRPGETIRNFLIGKRKNYFKPIAFAFALSTIYFLVSRIFESETFIGDAIKGYAHAASEAETGSRAEKIDIKMIPKLHWFSENYAVTVLLLLPIFSLASYISFLKIGWNYLEHFILNAYTTGQQALIYMFFALLNPIIDNDDIVVNLTLICSMCYNFIVFWQFFPELKRSSVILRSIGTYLLFFVFFMVLTSGLFIIAVVF